MPITSSGFASALKVLQLGTETTWGTAVAATRKLAGVLDGSTIAVSAEHAQTAELGRLYPSRLVSQVSQAGEAKVSMQCTYEHLIYPLHGLGTVTKTGSSDPYTWSFAAPTTATPTYTMYTIELGSGTTAYKLAGGLTTDLSIKGESKGVWTADWGLMGKAVSTVTLASLTDDTTAELIRSADTVLSVDAVGGTMGTTSVAATLRGFELSIGTKRHLKYFMGSLTPGDFGEDAWEGSLKLTLEYNSSAKAYIDALIGPALVQRQIQLKATSGSHTASIQFAGYLDGPITMFGNADGNITAELTFKAAYNTTFGNWCKIVVLNAASTLA